MYKKCNHFLFDVVIFFEGYPEISLIIVRMSLIEEELILLFKLEVLIQSIESLQEHLSSLQIVNEQILPYFCNMKCRVDFDSCSSGAYI